MLRLFGARRTSGAVEAFLDRLAATPYGWRLGPDGKLRALDGDTVLCAVTGVARHRTGQRYSVGDWIRAGARVGLSYADACLVVAAADGCPAGAAARRLRRRLLAAARLAPSTAATSPHRRRGDEQRHRETRRAHRVAARPSWMRHGAESVSPP
jgi:hypothetical protein